MTKKQKISNLVSTINEFAAIGRNRKIGYLTTEDSQLTGRTISISGRKHINFGSCSYLGLELDPRLTEGAIEALKRYGTQFSSSRTYVSLGLYEELEALIQKMYSSPVIVTTSTTIGHHAVMPMLVDDCDAVILDHQAHVSMHDAASKLQLRGVTVGILRHSRLDDLQQKIDELSVKHEKIWYCIDSVYSMYGDFAPLQELNYMLEKNKNLYLYVDDAHGMSWAGNNGTGYLRSQIPVHPKIVQGTSLSKAFGSGGGLFVFPNEEMYWRIKNWGGPLTYSGPEQPPVLGASIASAKIHLSEDIYRLQNTLAEKIRFCNEIFEHYELPLVSQTSAPIFFVGLGLTKVGFNLCERLHKEGFLVNLGLFPAVPESCTGIRFAINNHHTFDDIEALAERINFHLPKALKDENRTIQDIYRAFKSLSKKKEKLEEDGNRKENQGHNKAKLKLQHETTIHAIPEKLWNDLLADNGCFDWAGLSLLEESFKDNENPEHNWSFHYYIIRDELNKPVLATFFTSVLAKDDMLAPEEVSRKIEAIRKSDAYYLTSKAFMMGCVLTDGEHLYLDRTHKHWKDAMTILLDEVWVAQERENASVLIFRDFVAEDEEMKEFMLGMGLIKMDVPDVHTINNKVGTTREEFISILPHKKRYHIKQDVFKYQSNFELKIASSYSDEDIEHWYKLYENVRTRNLEINAFNHPKQLFYNMAKSSHWEVLLLNFKPELDQREKKTPVAVGFAYKNHNYCPVILGIDYDYLYNYKIYKQILYQTILRALDLNSRKVYLGLTSSLEKRKVGATVTKQVAYIQSKDHYNMSLVGLIPNTKLEYR